MTNLHLILLSTIQLTLSTPIHTEQRIVNGIPVTDQIPQLPNSLFPWMISLRQEVHIGNTIITNSFCGATLITLTPPIILTAAHCIDNFKYNTTDFTIRDQYNRINHLYADINRTYPENNIIDDIYTSLKITHPSQFIIHEKWNGMSLDGYDIAVIIFTDHNNTLLPIQLPQLPTKLSKNEPCCIENEYLYALGYGKNHTNGIGTFSLQITTLKYINFDECQAQILRAITNFTEPMIDAYITGDPNDNSFLCVLGNDTDICDGDSGGPIFRFVNNSDGIGVWEQIGIASFVWKNCNDGLPSVFTSIAHYYDWLNRIIIFEMFGDTYHPSNAPTEYTTYPTIETGVDITTVTIDNAANSLCYGLTVVLFVIFVVCNM